MARKLELSNARTSWVAQRLAQLWALWLPGAIFPAALSLFGQNELWLLLTASGIGVFIGVAAVTARWLVSRRRTTLPEPEADKLHINDAPIINTAQLEAEVRRFNSMCREVVWDILNNERNWVLLDEVVARDPSKYPVIEFFVDLDQADPFKRVSKGKRDDGRDVLVYGISAVDEKMKPAIVRDFISCLRFHDDFASGALHTELSEIITNYLFKKAYRSSTIKSYYRDEWGKDTYNAKLTYARTSVRNGLPQWSARGSSRLHRLISKSGQQLRTYAGRSIMRQNIRAQLLEVIGGSPGD